MTSQRLWSSLALAGWTAVVWIGRVRNVIQNDDLDGYGLAWRLVVAVMFVVMAALIAVGLLVVRRRPSSLPLLRGYSLALAVIGSLWWAIRGTQILLGDWDTGFKVVHTLLALGTFAISGWVWRSWRGVLAPGSNR